MTGTTMIHDLVREGRATPAQGAMLIEFRRELAASRERKLRRRSPVLSVLFTVATFLLVLIRIRKDS